MSNQLPHEIKKLASSLFARETGFSGPEIYAWFGQFSEEIGDYPWSDAPSRWTQFESCLEHFSLDEQCDLLFKLINYRGPSKYDWPEQSDLDTLNELLLEFTASRTATESIISEVSWLGVRDAWTKALERASSDPEGAITSARTTIESVCKHILDEEGIESNAKGDLTRLYKEVADILQLSPDNYGEEIFKQILGSCAGIASGLAGLRNAYGDSHGKGPKYVKPSPRHARLAINASMTLAEFLIATYEKKF